MFLVKDTSSIIIRKSQTINKGHANITRGYTNFFLSFRLGNPKFFWKGGVFSGQVWLVTFFQYKFNFDKFKYPVSADPINHFMKELDVGNPITFEAWGTSK